MTVRSPPQYLREGLIAAVSFEIPQRKRMIGKTWKRRGMTRLTRPWRESWEGAAVLGRNIRRKDRACVYPTGPGRKWRGLCGEIHVSNLMRGPTNSAYPRTSTRRGQEPSSLTSSASRARGTNLQWETPPGCVSMTMRFGLDDPSRGLYGGTFDAV